MPKGRIKPPDNARGIVYKIRLWKARMQHQKTILETTRIKIDDHNEIVLTGCDVLSDVSSKVSALENCTGILRKIERSSDSPPNPMNTIIGDD